MVASRSAGRQPVSGPSPWRVFFTSTTIDSCFSKKSMREQAVEISDVLIGLVVLFMVGLGIYDRWKTYHDYRIARERGEPMPGEIAAVKLQI